MGTVEFGKDSQLNLIWAKKFRGFFSIPLKLSYLVVHHCCFAVPAHRAVLDIAPLVLQHFLLGEEDDALGGAAADVGHFGAVGKVELGRARDAVLARGPKSLF